MKIGRNDLIRINREFGGNLRNEASLDFAIQQQENRRIGAYKKLAILWRTLLVDRPFSDGNKRTAAAVAVEFARLKGKAANEDKINRHAFTIARDNVSDLRRIERRLKNAIK